MDAVGQYSYGKPQDFQATQDARKHREQDRRIFLSIEEFCDDPLKGIEQCYQCFENDTLGESQQVELDFFTAMRLGMLHRSKEYIRECEHRTKEERERKRRKKSGLPRSNNEKTVVAADPDLATWLRAAKVDTETERTLKRLEKNIHWGD